MSFGLVNALSVFQALMNEIQRKMPRDEMVSYLDDTIIPTVTIEQDVERLRRFLYAIAEVGLTLRLDKCVFLAEIIKLLGHYVSADGI